MGFTVVCDLLLIAIANVKMGTQSQWKLFWQLFFNSCKPKLW